MREALEIALDDRSLPHHDLMEDIVQLCDLMEHASHVKVATKLISATLAETARSFG